MFGKQVTKVQTHKIPGAPNFFIVGAIDDSDFFAENKSSNTRDTFNSGQ